MSEEEKRTLKSFREILDKEENHNGLILLQKAGWDEVLPWLFEHSDFPGIKIDLSHRIPFVFRRDDYWDSSRRGL